MTFGDKRNDKYWKPEDGDELAIVGEEVTGHATFDSGARKMVRDPKGGFGFAVHAWNGEKLVLMQGGWRLYKAVGKVVSKHGPNAVVRIGKTGSGFDTAYTAEYVRDLSDEETADIAGEERYDLLREFPWADGADEEAGGNGGGDGAGAEDDCPF